MTAPTFTDAELWTITDALLAGYREHLTHRDECRRLAARPTFSIPPERFTEWADAADARMAKLDAIVAKMPAGVQLLWKTRIAELTAVAA